MDIGEITNYIFLPDDQDLKGDIAFVFGTWHAWQGSVAKAAELYSAGLVPKVIFSGGKNNETGENEGCAMAEEGIRLGIKREDVLVEDASTNTLENVLFSREVIDREIGLENVQIITAVVKNFHSRRALMTLKKNMPQHISYKVCTYLPFYRFTKDDWHQSEMGNLHVRGEYRKIKEYLTKGDLAEI